MTVAQSIPLLIKVIINKFDNHLKHILLFNTVYASKDVYLNGFSILSSVYIFYVLKSNTYIDFITKIWESKRYFINSLKPIMLDIFLI